MGKKNGSQLGRAIIKDRFGGGQGRQRKGDPTMLHTSELQDGYDWGRLNLQSVTEQSQLDEFLMTAELAGTEFLAEKMNIAFVNPKASYGLLTNDEKKKVKSAQDKHIDHLKIPRRPNWDKSMSGDELHVLERESFLEWRKSLSMLQEVEGITLTPYEKNLEFWCQLWRVVERSDVVVQIVDARNPLLFRCQDLEKYVTEVSQSKMNLLLINKADFLSHKQRELWAKYFDTISLKVAFFSALEEDQNTKMSNLRIQEEASESSVRPFSLEQTVEDVELAKDGKNSPKLLTRAQLIDLMKTIHKGPKILENRTVVGLVGYPNVGKSSTINALLTYKKVSVSATPGKTKHFQSINVDDELMLCDCPGLVMPSFVSTKHEMVIWGILPIDQMRDHVGPVNLICSFIPRHVLESTYGIFIPKPTEGEDPDRHPFSEELLNAYGFMRGFMTARGLPDNPRSARHILKDFVQGKLLYCVAPPNCNASEFQSFGVLKDARIKVPVNPTPLQIRTTGISTVNSKSIDQQFFHQNTSTAHAKGRVPLLVSTHTIGVTDNEQGAPSGTKPWKKHNKRNKREKLRRVYSHLDQ